MYTIYIYVYTYVNLHVFRYVDGHIYSTTASMRLQWYRCYRSARYHVITDSRYICTYTYIYMYVRVCPEDYHALCVAHSLPIIHTYMAPYKHGPVSLRNELYIYV